MKICLLVLVLHELSSVCQSAQLKSYEDETATTEKRVFNFLFKVFPSLTLNNKNDNGTVSYNVSWTGLLQQRVDFLRKRPSTDAPNKLKVEHHPGWNGTFQNITIGNSPAQNSLTTNRPSTEVHDEERQSTIQATNGTANATNSVFDEAAAEATALKKNRTFIRLSDRLKNFIVAKHNEKRVKIANGEIDGQPKAGIMYRLFWSDNIYEVASIWSTNCDLVHSKNQQYCGVEGYQHLGENMFAASLFPNQKLDTDEKLEVAFSEALESWFSEEKNFTHETNLCNATCGHYTQLVRWDVEKLGCGISLCEDGLSNFKDSGRSYVITCNYGPGHNYDFEPPYPVNKKQCPPARPVFQDSLCTGNGTVGKQPCVDTQPEWTCKQYKLAGRCELCNNKYYTWISNVCSKTCGFC